MLKYPEFSRLLSKILTKPNFKYEENGVINSSEEGIQGKVSNNEQE
ncbi:10338_t:CDS:1 [Ambispora gerdemannii]|uniref:10338_t:CDS:1 n=1 Tax=Ambispora gerdemannii TaxID=144530 RepID=A0A9N9BZF5_9GLOM|nr:10338_t:CDS:1 [Ambispora gerdemannii]